MRRIAWTLGLLTLALGACTDTDTMSNALGVSYLIDSQAQIPDARHQAEALCGPVQRQPRLSNVTQFQHLLVVFDCRPPGEVRFEVRPQTPQLPPATEPPKS
jgi:hypothetical protein